MAVQTLELPRIEIADLCRKHGVRELSVFGSALRQDFGPESDIDFLVDFADGDCGPWLSKLTSLEAGLAQVLGRRVDVVPKSDLKWVIRDRVLASAQVIYDSEE